MRSETQIQRLHVIFWSDFLRQKYDQFSTSMQYLNLTSDFDVRKWRLENNLHTTSIKRQTLTSLKRRANFKCLLGIHSTKDWSKGYIVYICRVFKRGLIVDEFYPWYVGLRVHLKSGCQYQFTRKRWHLKQNGVFSKNKQDTENDVHLSTQVFLRG